MHDCASLRQSWEAARLCPLASHDCLQEAQSYTSGTVYPYETAQRHAEYVILLTTAIYCPIYLNMLIWKPYFCVQPVTLSHSILPYFSLQLHLLYCLLQVYTVLYSFIVDSEAIFVCIACYYKSLYCNLLQLTYISIVLLTTNIYCPIKLHLFIWKLYLYA